ncbi:hypothetical protein BJF89_04760 [Corynebacterium sp. CNJ-954]|nr:hypothetical protein BJF89_04760 [Corynebacterium sp. CNJ-954]
MGVQQAVGAIGFDEFGPGNPPFPPAVVGVAGELQDPEGYHDADAEVLRDLRDGGAVLAGPSHAYDVFVEPLGVEGRHGAHPSGPRSGQATSDVT